MKYTVITGFGEGVKYTPKNTKTTQSKKGG